MLGRYGQAQRLEAWAKRLAFHAGADLAFIWSLRDLPVEVLKKLQKSVVLDYKGSLRNIESRKNES